jgi:conserved oligomeric Golgi complex subunit 3
MTERHLGTLINDADGTLKVLETLCQSFRAVEEQTKTFKAQCDDLLSEQKRLQVLVDEVGTDLYYYSYLDNVTRRLNAPGAGRLVDDDAFSEVLENLEACIAFMSKNVGLSSFQGAAVPVLTPHRLHIAMRKHILHATKPS